MRTITITVEKVCLTAELKDTPTAEALFHQLPLAGAARVWGEEIYFEIPIGLPLEPESRTTVAVGDLGYWPAGPAFCIFFGPTPASTDQRPRAYSPVNVFGHVTGDTARLKTVTGGSMVRVTAVKKGPS